MLFGMLGGEPWCAAWRFDLRLLLAGRITPDDTHFARRYRPSDLSLCSAIHSFTAGANKSNSCESFVAASGYTCMMRVHARKQPASTGLGKS